MPLAARLAVVEVELSRHHIDYTVSSDVRVFRDRRWALSAAIVGFILSIPPSSKPTLFRPAVYVNFVHTAG